MYNSITHFDKKNTESLLLDSEFRKKATPHDLLINNSAASSLQLLTESQLSKRASLSLFIKVVSIVVIATGIFYKKFPWVALGFIAFVISSIAHSNVQKELKRRRICGIANYLLKRITSFISIKQSSVLLINLTGSVGGKQEHLDTLMTHAKNIQNHWSQIPNGQFGGFIDILLLRKSLRNIPGLSRDRWGNCLQILSDYSLTVRNFYNENESIRLNHFKETITAKDTNLHLSQNNTLIGTIREEILISLTETYIQENLNQINRLHDYLQDLSEVLQLIVDNHGSEEIIEEVEVSTNTSGFISAEFE